jgi:hypothetical protein
MRISNGISFTQIRPPSSKTVRGQPEMVGAQPQVIWTALLVPQLRQGKGHAGFGLWEGWNQGARDVIRSGPQPSTVWALAKNIRQKKEVGSMKMEVRHGRNSLTRLVAGVVLVVASVLVLLHNSYWALLTGFIGLTHITSSTVGFCPLEKFLHHVLHLPVQGSD